MYSTFSLGNATRTKNYIAFDGDESYMSYLKLLNWSCDSSCELTIDNAHDINDARDDSLPESIKHQLKERLDKSKNMILIIDSAIRRNRKGIIKYEINYALRNRIPIILAFKGYNTNDNVDNERWNRELFPKVPKILCEAEKENKFVLVCPFNRDVLTKALYYSCYNLPQCGFTWHWR